MADIAALADRAASGTEALARLGSGLARKLAMFAGAVAAICVLLALFGLSGDATVVALVLTAGAVVLAIVGPALSWWRLRSVRADVKALTGEFRQLFERDHAARRNVIETVEHGDSPDAPSARLRPGSQGTRPYVAMRGFDLGQLRGLTHLTAAFTVLARLPAVLALAFLGTVALVFLALAFALAALL